MATGWSAFFLCTAGQDKRLSMVGRQELALSVSTSGRNPNCCFCCCFVDECVSRRREALSLRLGRLRLEVCPFGRADASLQEAHGPSALPVSEVRPGLLSLRPPGAAHEEALMRRAGSRRRKDLGAIDLRSEPEQTKLFWENRTAFSHCQAIRQAVWFITAARAQSEPPSWTPVTPPPTAVPPPACWGIGPQSSVTSATSYSSLGTKTGSNCIDKTWEDQVPMYDWNCISFRETRYTEHTHLASSQRPSILSATFHLFVSQSTKTLLNILY